jgi:hypothetical protein
MASYSYSIIALILGLFLLITSSITLSALNSVKDDPQCYTSKKKLEDGKNTAIATLVIGILLVCVVAYNIYRKYTFTYSVTPTPVVATSFGRLY